MSVFYTESFPGEQSGWTNIGQIQVNRFIAFERLLGGERLEGLLLYRVDVETLLLLLLLQHTLDFLWNLVSSVFLMAQVKMQVMWVNIL